MPSRHLERRRWAHCTFALFETSMLGSLYLCVIRNGNIGFASLRIVHRAGVGLCAPHVSTEFSLGYRYLCVVQYVGFRPTKFFEGGGVGFGSFEEWGLVVSWYGSVEDRESVDRQCAGLYPVSCGSMPCRCALRCVIWLYTLLFGPTPYQVDDWR